MSNNHALLIGIGKRDDDNDIMSVTADDARKLKDLLDEKWSEKNVVAKTSDDKSINTKKEDILKALDELILTTASKRADMVWVFFSGHGCKYGENYYLICHDTKKDKLSETAILGNCFVDKLLKIKTEKLLVILDCCHSGGINMPNTDSIPIPFDKDVFINNKNKVIITASSEKEVALAAKPLSVFTHVLIEGLYGRFLSGGKREILLFDLAMYVRERIKTNNKKQTPQLQTIRDSGTQNFCLIEHPEGYQYNIDDVFGENYTLKDFKGKSIDFATEDKQDKEYRNIYNWLNIDNSIDVNGDGNIVIQNNSGKVTINQNITEPELITLLRKINNELKIQVSLLKDMLQNFLETQQGQEKIRTVTSVISKIDEIEINHINLIDLLREAFDNDKLRSFCYKYFKNVHNNFSKFANSDEMTEELLSYCYQRRKTGYLLGCLKEERPEVYDIFIDNIIS